MQRMKKEDGNNISFMHALLNQINFCSKKKSSCNGGGQDLRSESNRANSGSELDESEDKKDGFGAVEHHEMITGWEGLY